MDKCVISLCSPPDREKLVAEVMFGSVQLAEINQEKDVLEVELYPRPDGEPWRISYSDLMDALEKAKASLINIEKSKFFNNQE